jgi:hypothetical protein
MNENRVRVIVFRAAILVFAAGLTVLLAQQLANVSGVVTDPSGARMAQVSVKLRNVATGEVLSTASGESGVYTIPALKPGNYELSAEHAGFKQYRQTGIVLGTGVSARADVVLELGSVSDSITVDAALAQLRTESASVGSVVTGETIQSMPLIGRRAAQLARLNGFVVGSGSNFAMAGGRGNNAAWSIDGGNAQNIIHGQATLNIDPPIDSLQEFDVQVSSYKAELGRTGGGIIQMTTKSGTNRFHGSAYKYFRNDALDARSFFSAGKSRLRYNLFGASLGGPIKRDRTFFFFSFEGIRNNSQATILASIPTRQEASGNFAGSSTSIRDPLTQTPFPGNAIPASRLDPVGRSLAAFYPEPNVPGAASRNNNFRAQQQVRAPSNVGVVRIDHAISDTHRVFGHYLTGTAFFENGPIFPTPGVDSNHTFGDRPYNRWSVTWLHNIRPTTLGEFRYQGDWRFSNDWAGGLDAGLVDRIGLKGTNPRYFPRINVTGVYALGTTNHERIQQPIQGSNWSYSLTHTRGNHTLKFGAQYRNSSSEDLVRNDGGGTFAFTPVATGDALASLLTGWVASGSRDESDLLRTVAGTVGLFAQTDWKVTPKLTLNLGLRWDLDQPRRETMNNQQNSFDAGALNPVCNCPGMLVWSGRNGRSEYAHNLDYNNFGPRFGFAYRATDKWVVRGGAGVVYVGAYDAASPTSVRIGFSTQGNFVSPDGGRSAAFILKDGVPPLKKLTETDLVPGFGAVPFGQNPVLNVEYFEPQGRATPYLENWSFNVQRQLSANLVLEMGYLGTRGHKLVAPVTRSINQVPPDRIRSGNVQALRPFPQFSDVGVVQPTIGNSNYNGMNVRIEKRMSRGLLFNANYTWAKAIDDTESRAELGGNTGTDAFSNQYDRRADKGLSGNHIKHRLIASALWELPIGKGKPIVIGNRVLEAVAGGWSLSAILEARSGLPFGVIESNAAAIYPTAVTVRSSATAAFARNPNWRANVLGEKFFQTAGFVAPAFGTFGNLGRTVATGPGSTLADLSILKGFQVRERHRLEFRGDFLNFANHPVFGLPNQSRGTAAFGSINSLSGGARILQLGLHYRF